MQDDVSVFIDLRGDIERDTREKGLQGDIRRHHIAAGAGRRIGADASYKEIVGADLEYRLLIVGCRDARAGQHLHVALSLKEGQ